MSEVATTSAMGDEGSLRAVGDHEHVSNVRRLRAVLGIGLIMWIAVGVPGDVLVAATFPGSDLLELLRVRAAAVVVLALGLWAVSREQLPSAEALRGVEVGTFTALAAATALLLVGDVGLASPTAAQLSCILLAQGTAFPRPWQRGALALAWTCLAFLVVVAGAVAVDPRIAAQAAQAAQARLFLAGLWSALCSLVILVVGGHAAWALRRRAFAARHVGRYQLKRKLGEGGMGEVWVAWHAGLKRDVAVKVLRSSRFRSRRDRFLQEIEATSRLCHPNTVRVLDRGVADGDHWYFAMELVDGSTLRAVVDAEGPMPAARAVHIVSQVCRALAEAHGLGIVHRDLKPDNVLVVEVGAERDFAKVCDFGLAHITEASSLPVVTTSGPLPRERLGCMRWAAPEQLRGGDADARADVYALGGLLVFALTGTAPRDAPDLSRLEGDVRRVVERCLAQHAGDRYADAAEVGRALDATAVAGLWTLC